MNQSTGGQFPVFIAEVPDWFDERTRYQRLFDGALLLIHPDHAPLIVELDGTIRPILYSTIRTACSVQSIFN